jgi:hypothetical protein
MEHPAANAKINTAGSGSGPARARHGRAIPKAPKGCDEQQPSRPPPQRQKAVHPHANRVVERPEVDPGSAAVSDNSATPSKRYPHQLVEEKKSDHYPGRTELTGSRRPNSGQSCSDPDGPVRHRHDYVATPPVREGQPENVARLRNQNDTENQQQHPKLEVKPDGWRVYASITNDSNRPIPLEQPDLSPLAPPVIYPQQGISLVVAPSQEQRAQGDGRHAISPARIFNPAMPHILTAHQTWTGSFAGTDTVPRNRRIYIGFGRFNPGPHPSAVR